MKKNLLIVGAGGHGKVVLDMAKSMECYNEIAFLDDKNAIGKEILDCPIIGTTKDLALFKDKFEDVAIAIGNNDIRISIGHEAIKMGYNLPIISHRSSIISSYSSIGKGTIIMPNVVINADSKIGELVILNTASIIEHDCVIEDGVHISYGAILGSNVKVGKKCTVDMGYIVERNIHISK